MIDIHLHTRFSFDSKEEPENFIGKANSLGIKSLGFSEHYDYDAFLDGADISLCDVPAYAAYLNKLRENYPDTEILFGIELGYSPAAEEEFRKLTNRYPFDYVINSVHTLPGRGDCYYPRFFDGITLRQAYTDYFNAVLASVKADYDYQIVGHIGYVSRYCKGENALIKYYDYSEIFDEILKEIIKRDKCLEINTSTGEANCDFFPDKDIIIRYLQLGGEKLSFASDAHSAEKYRKGADKVKQFLSAEGVSELCYFKNRQCLFYKI